MHGYHEGWDVYHLWSHLLPNVHSRGHKLTEEMSDLSEEVDTEKHTSDISVDLWRRRSRGYYALRCTVLGPLFASKQTGRICSSGLPQMEGIQFRWHGRFKSLDKGRGFRDPMGERYCRKVHAAMMTFPAPNLLCSLREPSRVELLAWHWPFQALLHLKLSSMLSWCLCVSWSNGVSLESWYAWCLHN